MSNWDFPQYDLAELHTHLGASISPTTYWEIAQDIGFVLPEQDYHEFIKYVTISPDNPTRLEEYWDKVYHKLLDHLSSGVRAAEKGVYEIFSGAYRSNNVRLLELRTNPMKHNNEGTIDLDRLIMAMLRGMEKALLAYPKLSGGLIFCLAREFGYATNKIVIEKAIKYRKRGVVGVDVAGPYNEFDAQEYEELFERARTAGLGATIHTGERKVLDDMWEIVEVLKPDRIGHGVYAAYDAKLMKELVRRDIVLEVCPFANLATKTVENVDEIRWILRTFIENDVKFTINTDWAEMIEGNHLHETFDWLLKEKILSEEELRCRNELAFRRSFIKSSGLKAYL
jgi:adenosine deaminase